MDPASLVVFKLNNVALRQANGFPARAIFPGWYGMDAVKWLCRVVVVSAADRDTLFERSGLNRVYNRVNNAGEITRLTFIQVKSVIAWPANSFKLPAAHHTVWGFAWSGQERIQHVNISIDGGRRWRPATLGLQTNRYSWVKWSYSWNASPGDYTLMSRATDAAGNEQPLRRDAARKDAYELNWCVPLSGSVR